MANDSLPDFEAGKTYLISGATGKALVDAIRRYRPDIVTGSGLDKEVRADGTYFKGGSIPAPPSGGVYVLGTDGAGGLTWIGTDTCS
jgi:hypothetical protein